MKQVVPDPKKSFKPIKSIPQGNKGIFIRFWIGLDRKNDFRKRKYVASRIIARWIRLILMVCR